MNSYIKKAQYNKLIQILRNRGMRKQGWWWSRKEPKKVEDIKDPTDFEKGTTIDVNGFKVTNRIDPTSDDAQYILPGLDNIKRITQELNQYAPYAPKNTFEIHPEASDRWGDNTLSSGKIRVFGEGNRHGSVIDHEVGHSATGPMSLFTYDSDNESTANKSMWRNRAINRYEVEEPAVMQEIARKALDKGYYTDINVYAPNYEVFTRSPYMWNMGQITSPMGFTGDMSKERWYDMTLPAKNPQANYYWQQVLEPPKEKNKEEIIQRPTAEEIEKRHKVKKEVLNDLKNSDINTFLGKHVYGDTGNAFFDREIVHEFMRSYDLDYFDDKLKDKLVTEYGIPPTKADMVATAIKSHITKSHIDVPEVVKPVSGMEEEKYAPIDALAAMNDKLLNDTNLTYTDYEKMQTLKAFMRRGINATVPNENGEQIFTPMAVAQSLSQQNDPEYKDIWNEKWNQFNERLQQYKANPRYFNVMKRWLLSPYGDSFKGTNKPSLTIEQMDNILNEFDREDEYNSIENLPGFQGIQYGETPYASMA